MRTIAPLGYINIIVYKFHNCQIDVEENYEVPIVPFVPLLAKQN